VYVERAALVNESKQPLLCYGLCDTPIFTVFQTGFLLLWKESLNWKLGEERWVVEIIRLVVDWIYMLDFIVHHS